MMNNTDINNKEDIHKMVSWMYMKLIQLPAFQGMFTVISKNDVLEHIETIVDFWDKILFHAGQQYTNIIQPHIDLYLKYNYRLQPEHYRLYIETFNNNADELFSGENISNVKKKAMSLMIVLKLQLEELEIIRQQINN